MLESLWTCEDDAKLKALILMWELWGLWNKVNAGDTIRSTLEVTRCREAPTSLLVSKPPNQTSELFVKVNFDGAFNKASCSGVWGFIICNHKGEFVAEGAGKSCHTETVACLLEVEGTTRTGVNHIILESNSTNLVRAL
jgi:hypothetical protein